jgi:hypothetical protein
MAYRIVTMVDDLSDGTQTAYYILNDSTNVIVARADGVATAAQIRDALNA